MQPKAMVITLHLIPRVRTLVEEKDYVNRDQTSKNSEWRYINQVKMCGRVTLSAGEIACPNGWAERRSKQSTYNTFGDSGLKISIRMVSSSSGLGQQVFILPTGFRIPQRSPFMVLWYNGYYARLSRGQPGSDSRQHRQKENLIFQKFYDIIYT